jgi:hypothetical protein
VMINGRGQGSGDEGAAASWTTDQKIQIDTELQMAGATLAEVAVIYASDPAAGQMQVRVTRNDRRRSLSCALSCTAVVAVHRLTAAPQFAPISRNSPTRQYILGA